MGRETGQAAPRHTGVLAHMQPPCAMGKYHRPLYVPPGETMSRQSRACLHFNSKMAAELSTSAVGPNFVLPADGDATGSNARNTFRCECGRVDRWTRTSGDGRTQTMTAAAKASPRTARIEMPRPCSQCQKTAVILFQGAHGLCVDCYYKFELARTLGLRIAAVGINLAGEQMDFASGFHGFTPRTAVPDLPKGPPVFNNIKVDNCVVGAANTGTMQSIDLNLTVLSIAGQEKMREGLKAFTEAVVNEKSLSAQRRANCSSKSHSSRSNLWPAPTNANPP